MSRSGYSDDCDNAELYRANVDRALKGRRGQTFLRDLASAMDALPEKVLITDELVDADGACCAVGAVCIARGMDVASIEYDNPWSVGKAMGIAKSMAAEIAYENDEADDIDETPEARWLRMRRWVDKNLVAV